MFLLNRQNVVEPTSMAQSGTTYNRTQSSRRSCRGWGDSEVLRPRLHDCHVEQDGSIWVVAAGTGYIQKYSHDGSEMLMRIGQKGIFDSSDGSRQGIPLNSDRAQFFLPAAIDVDKATGDIYVADGELPGGNSRIIVMDKEGSILKTVALYRTNSDQA